MQHLGHPHGEHPVTDQVSHLQASDEPGDETSIFWYREVTKWHMSMFARMLEAMKADADLGPTLLDRSLVVALSEMSYGGVHHPYNLPVLLAGGGLRGGRHVHFPCRRAAPSSNNWGYARYDVHRRRRDPAGQPVADDAAGLRGARCVVRRVDGNARGAVDLRE